MPSTSHDGLSDGLLDGDGTTGTARVRQPLRWTILRTADVSTRRAVPFAFFVVAWLCLVMLMGGAAVMMIEGSAGARISWIDAMFTIANAATASGLSSVNIAALRPGSHAAIALSWQLGGSTLISLLPVLLRLRALRPLVRSKAHRSLPTRGAPRVRQWDVEREALLLLLRVVLCFHVGVAAAAAGMMAPRFAAYFAAHPDVHADSSVAGWAAFHALSAFNNVGYTLTPDSLQPFIFEPLVLLPVALASLAGNVLYPLLIRWCVVALSCASPKGSWRKVRCRYLLLNGRSVCPFLFGSDQT